MSFQIYFDKTASGEPCARLDIKSATGNLWTRVCPYGKRFGRTGKQAKEILLAYIKAK